MFQAAAYTSSLHKPDTVCRIFTNYLYMNYMCTPYKHISFIYILLSLFSFCELSSHNYTGGQKGGYRQYHCLYKTCDAVQHTHSTREGLSAF